MSFCLMFSMIILIPHKTKTETETPFRTWFSVMYSELCRIKIYSFKKILRSDKNIENYRSISSQKTQTINTVQMNSQAVDAFIQHKRTWTQRYRRSSSTARENNCKCLGNVHRVAPSTIRLRPEIKHSLVYPRVHSSPHSIRPASKGRILFPGRSPDDVSVLGWGCCVVGLCS